MWAIEHGLEPCMHVVIYFKWLPQICTKMSGFKFDFSKIFWGGAHRAPSPDPSPRFSSGFALGLGFALDSRALRALDSGFALNFRLENLVWPPKINSWIRPWSAPNVSVHVLTCQCFFLTSVNIRMSSAFKLCRYRVSSAAQDCVYPSSPRCPNTHPSALMKFRPGKIYIP